MRGGRRRLGEVAADRVGHHVAGKGDAAAADDDFGVDGAAVAIYRSFRVAQSARETATGGNIEPLLEYQPCRAG